MSKNNYQSEELKKFLNIYNILPSLSLGSINMDKELKQFLLVFLMSIVWMLFSFNNYTVYFKETLVPTLIINLILYIRSIKQ